MVHAIAVRHPEFLAVDKRRVMAWAEDKGWWPVVSLWGVAELL